jgi:ATP-dependent 26S proteasome regulatory subunit
MPTKIHSGKAIDKIAANSRGLSGAWIREIVQTAMIEAISSDRTEIDVPDLEAGLEDVLMRRGMAYKATPGLSDKGVRNSEVSVV